MQEHGAGSRGHLGAGTSHQSRSEPGSISTGFGVSWWWCGEGRGRRGARLGADPEHRVLSGGRRHAWAGTELCSVAPWRWKQPASRGSPGLCAEGGRLGGRGTGTREPLGGAGGGVMTATNETEACARRSPEPLAGGVRRSVTGELVLASVTCVTGTARGVRSPSGGPRGPEGRCHCGRPFLPEALLTVHRGRAGSRLSAEPLMSTRRVLRLPAASWCRVRVCFLCSCFSKPWRSPPRLCLFSVCQPGGRRLQLATL